jgi:hypothetical protein
MPSHIGRYCSPEMLYAVLSVSDTQVPNERILLHLSHICSIESCPESERESFPCFRFALDSVPSGDFSPKREFSDPLLISGFRFVAD